VRTEIYHTAKQRRNILKTAVINGETMIHDNFFSDHKEMVFDVVPKLPPDPKEILLELLLGKLRNNTITFEQLKTLIRLEHKFELTQTTRDKILIAVQGIVGTLRDRLKSAFGL